MPIWILPNGREVQTLHALKKLGMSISTVRTKDGTERNVATQPIDISNVTRFPRGFMSRITKREKE